MDRLTLDRRRLMGAAALLAGAGVAAGAQAQPAATGFEPKPLPFDPKSVPGLSEKLLVSHHDNNYVGAVRRLGQIRGELAGLDMAATPGYRLNGLKREELIAWNSMILHELYFAGFGAPEKPSARLGQGIERDFGSYEKWAAEFSATG